MKAEKRTHVVTSEPVPDVSEVPTQDLVISIKKAAAGLLRDASEGDWIFTNPGSQAGSPVVDACFATLRNLAIKLSISLTEGEPVVIQLIGSMINLVIQDPDLIRSFLMHVDEQRARERLVMQEVRKAVACFLQRDESYQDEVEDAGEEGEPQRMRSSSPSPESYYS